MSATDVSDVVVVTSSSQKKMMWALSGALVFLVLSVFHNVSLRNDVETARTLASSYAMERDALKKKLDASTSLQSELARTKQTLASEIARKKELAVMYERAESARKQAVADHKVLADKLRAYESKKAPIKKK
jgi:hypothetical protein